MVAAVVCLAVCLAPSGGASAHIAPTVPMADSLEAATSRLDVRTPADERLAAYRSNDTYDYVREAPEEGRGLFGRIIRWLMEAIGGTEWGVQLTGYVIYAVIFLLVAYGILVLIRMEPSASRRRRDSSNYQRDELDERVQEADFDALIEHALEDQDYRSTLRLLYLRALQILDRNDWIEWAPERTNAHYERSLRRTTIGDTFREATHIFDIVWYGDVDVGAAEFDELRRPFDVVTEQAKKTAPQDTSHAGTHPSSTSDSSWAGGESA